MIKRIFALALVLVICLAAVACSNDTPDGMHLVSSESEPFKLYVPKAWTSNLSSGVSGAFFSTGDIAVTARYTVPEKADITDAEYVELVKKSYAEQLSGYTDRQTESAVVAEKNATMLRYAMVKDEVEFTFCEYIVRHKDGFVSLAFRAPSTSYDSHTETFNMIVEEFVLCEPMVSDTAALTDKKTPEGMKIASSDVVEYRLYVPNAWVCSPEDGRSDAYLDIAGRPNVSVTSYSPDEAITAEQYFEKAQEEYKKSLAGYELLSTADRTVAEREAKAYTYRVQSGEQTIRIMQTVFVYNQMVYSFTYTALDSDFDAHMSDVNSMLDAFRFR